MLYSLFNYATLTIAKHNQDNRPRNRASRDGPRIAYHPPLRRKNVFFLRSWAAGPVRPVRPVRPWSIGPPRSLPPQRRRCLDILTSQIKEELGSPGPEWRLEKTRWVQASELSQRGNGETAELVRPLCHPGEKRGFKNEGKAIKLPSLWRLVDLALWHFVSPASPRTLGGIMAVP